MAITDFCSLIDIQQSRDAEQPYIFTFVITCFSQGRSWWRRLLWVWVPLLPQLSCEGGHGHPSGVQASPACHGLDGALGGGRVALEGSLCWTTWPSTSPALPTPTQCRLLTSAPLKEITGDPPHFQAVAVAPVFLSVTAVALQSSKGLPDPKSPKYLPGLDCVAGSKPFKSLVFPLRFLHHLYGFCRPPELSAWVLQPQGWPPKLLSYLIAFF